MGLSGASRQRWLDRQRRDGYVQSARRNGLRSRAWFKLSELCASEAILRPGDWVLDVGAAPGGWSSYARSRVGDLGRVVACDRASMAPLAGVHFVQGDWLCLQTHQQISQRLEGRLVQVLLCDMAPNLTGCAVVDQAQMQALVDQVLQLLAVYLSPGGRLVMKAFQGEHAAQWRHRLQALFGRVAVRKPPASRAAS